MVSNLLNNAAKYRPQGGRIALSVQVEAATVRISIKDNGVGLDANFLPHLFDLFTQGHRTSDRSQGGLGLGLALVKSILLMHRGHIEARSDGLGLGSTFIVTLPRWDSGAAASSGNTDADAPSARAMHIMVVDDNRDAAQSLAILLEARGHQVMIAGDAREALKVAAINPPDAFILDIGMPGMSGYELATHLRKQPATSRARLIALTGCSQAHDRVLSKAAGFAHHLVKPVVLAELERALADSEPMDFAAGSLQGNR